MAMNAEFSIHNLFKEDLKLYSNHDPHLSRLKEAKYVFHPPLAENMPFSVPGIYILTGGRQIGKSTLIKMLIKNLLTKKGIPPKHIFYLPCDLIGRYQELVPIMHKIFDETGREGSFYLFIDEITYVKDWDRAIKYFADLGYFRKGRVLITGSDSAILKEGMKKFPGRRGKSDITDFHYYPVSFFEYLSLLAPKLKSAAKEITAMISPLEKLSDLNIAVMAKKFPSSILKTIARYFDQYLLTGGFLPAINEYYDHKKINKFVYQTYQQWVIGDILKRGKKEQFLKEIITALSNKLSKQISIHNIASETEIQHHATVQEYLAALEDMDVLFVQPALREDKLKAAPKKAKKIHFSDPFIAQSLISWARDLDTWNFACENIIKESRLKEALAEGCLSSLIRRKHKTYYIKSEGEVDIAVPSIKGFIPIEIKWTENLKGSELKQILKYKNGIIAYKGTEFGKYAGISVLPASVLALLEC